MLEGVVDLYPFSNTHMIAFHTFSLWVPELFSIRYGRISDVDFPIWSRNWAPYSPGILQGPSSSNYCYISRYFVWNANEIWQYSQNTSSGGENYWEYCVTIFFFAAYQCSSLITQTASHQRAKLAYAHQAYMYLWIMLVWTWHAHNAKGMSILPIPLQSNGLGME